MNRPQIFIFCVIPGHRILPVVVLIFFSLQLFAQKSAADADDVAIRTLLARQEAAWNRGDLEGFMQGYWKSDSMMFIGKSGFTYGWNATLSNYRKGYPDTAHMGQLRFELVSLNRLSANAYFVAGRWFLTRSAGNIGGAFTLLFRKKGGQWYIVADHSS